VEFDNDSDPDATIITISGRDKADLLMALTGSFNALELRVVSANILSRDDGRVLDNFRVTDMHDAKAQP
jgi:UTP:GlnB (protein PII) uridylyltransferase